MSGIIPSVKLGIAISYYSLVRSKCLDKCLHSIHNFWFDTPEWFTAEWILIDGIYRHYGNSKYYPTTSCIETRSMVNDHIEAMESEAPEGRFSVAVHGPGRRKERLPEKQKRQLALDIAADDECDFVLSLDSDEYIDNDSKHGAACWPQFAEELKWIKYRAPFKSNIYGVKSIEVDQRISNRSIFRPKLFYKPKYIRYTDNHYTWNVPGPVYNITSPLAVYHDPRCKTRQEVEDMEYYKRRLPWSE